VTEQIDQLAKIQAPYGREVTIKEVTFDSGMKLLRVTIREGKRITSVDIDPATANAWSAVMSDWAASNDT